MKKIIIVLAISIFAGCNPNSIFKYKDNNCSTVAEGFYTFPRIWNTYAPAIVFKKGVSIKFGSVIKQDNKNIVFVTAKRRSTDNPDTIVYPLNVIRTIIDSSGRCVYGDIPVLFSADDIWLKIYLSRQNGELKENIYWELYPNEQFAYCMKPGKYNIVKIEFNSNAGEDASTFIPFQDFYIDSNKTTFVGNFYLGPDSCSKFSTYKIPYETVEDNKRSGMIASFGLLGGLLYSLAKAVDTAGVSYYKMSIKDDSTFIPESKGKFVKHIVH